MPSRSRVERRDDRGSVTAEFAVVVPAVIVVLACALTGVQVGTQQVRLQDAASVAARAVARGEPLAIERMVESASAALEREDGLVCVTASLEHALAGGLFGDLSLRARACAPDATGRG